MVDYHTLVDSQLFIAAKKKTFSTLDGSYQAFVRGRGTNFDDLRPYVSGDSIKSVDWKASARFGNTVVRQNRMEKSFPIIFVVDTGLGLRAWAPSGEQKSHIMVNVVNLLGGIALRHGDGVGAVFDNVGGTVFVPPKGVEPHLGRIVGEMVSAVDDSTQGGDIMGQLNFLLTRKVGRSIVVVVSGGVVSSDRFTKILGAVRNKHELLWVTIDDVNPFLVDPNFLVGDIVFENVFVPLHLRESVGLREAFEKEELRRTKIFSRIMREWNISHVRVGSTETVGLRLVDLLQRRARDGR